MLTCVRQAMMQQLQQAVETLGRENSWLTAQVSTLFPPHLLSAHFASA